MEMKTPSSAAGSEPERTAGDWTWQMSCRTPSLPVCGGAVGKENPSAMVLGEVWEDGSNKIAYGDPAETCWAPPGRPDELPPSGQPPWIICWAATAPPSVRLWRFAGALSPFAFHNAMNFLGTHDTPRILTVLGLGTAEATEAADTLLTAQKSRR